MASDTRSLDALTRRDFLRGATAAAATAVVAGLLPAGPASAAPAAVPVEDRWLGADYWANRPQDWVNRGGRLTCVDRTAGQPCRTIGVLTRSLTGARFRLKIRTGTDVAGAGFSGFLVGTGERDTDYRRAALIGSASGLGGGLFCVYDADGRVRFREHTNDLDQFAYAEVPSAPSGAAPPRRVGEQVDLTLDGVPGRSGVTLTLQAVDVKTGTVLSKAVLAGQAASSVTGGICLVSAGPTAAHWLQNLRSTYAGVALHPERALGPIVGTLFSVAGGTLKMTAQCVPMLLQPTDAVSLQVPDGIGGWQAVASAPIGPGFAAALRVEGWDSTRATPYRVVAARGGLNWSGVVPAEPGETGLTVLSLSCTKATHRAIDRKTRYTPMVAQEKALGLYTSRNVYFPHEQLIAGMRAQRPDLIVAMGDQYYENNPTDKDESSAPELDFLYKYLLWLWAFRDITRDTPCCVLVDDHDVFQSNLYGEGGAPLTTPGAYDTGGYANDPEWINTVQRVQCGHNPDPVDPRPAAQGITVYFTRFDYGGVRFALVEDRKFKTGADGLDADGVPIRPEQLELLGSRQEAMLAGLAAEGSGPPTVVVSQTMYSCLQTSTSGRKIAVRDPAGWPPVARSRAVTSMARAGAVLLSGDTHLAALLAHSEGVLQFSGPAGGATFVRWFEPATPLPNPAGTPFTGDFVDAFGNAGRVLAVANMHIDQKTWVDTYGNHDCGDRDLKEEGYGVLRIDPVARTHTFESWRWDVDPTAPGAAPMPGWPYVLPFPQPAPAP